MRDARRHEYAARLMRELIRAEQKEARQSGKELTVQQATRRLLGGKG